MAKPCVCDGLNYLQHKTHYLHPLQRFAVLAGGKREAQDRPSTSRAKETLRDRGVSHEAQLTIVPMQHTKVSFHGRDQLSILA